VALRGRVFDVSANSDTYGPEGPYHLFAGHDVIYSSLERATLLLPHMYSLVCLVCSSDLLVFHVLFQGDDEFIDHVFGGKGP
jgi:hypothetical protein